MRRLGVALGGGGAKGMSHIAFLEAIDGMGLRPTVVAGTSIGALIGAFYCSGVTPPALLTLLRSLGVGDLARIFGFGLRGLRLPNRFGMSNGAGIEDFMTRNIPARRFEDLENPLRVVATDFWSRSQRVFAEGDLVRAVRASLSLPGILEPVRLDGRIYIDGGAVNPVPFDVIRDLCDVLVAIDVAGEKAPPEQADMPSMFEAVLSTFQIMEASILESRGRRAQPDILIRPALTNIRVLEFDKWQLVLESVESEVETLREELAGKMGSKRPDRGAGGRV